MSLSGSLHYATYFDRHYASRGLALYESLVRHSPPFTLWVLCLDEVTAAALRGLALPNVELVPLVELEKAEPALLRVKPDRLPFEYYWTCGPAYLLHLLEQREIDLLTYLDADLFFFGDPSPLLAELGDGSIFAVPMRYGPAGPLVDTGARFNVGFNAFRRSSQGMACLARWREQCLERCYERPERGYGGDQSYLSEWPAHYSEFVASDNIGAGVAPWNLANFRLGASNGQPAVDGVPVVYYHFSCLRIVRPWLYEPNLRIRGVLLTAAVKRLLYAPYARSLRQATRRLRAVSRAVPEQDTLARRNSQVSPIETLLHRTFLVVTDSIVL